MTQALAWTARLLGADGAPLAGITLVVEAYDVAARGWVAQGSTSSADDGTAKGRVQLAEAALAPALRLLAGEAVVAAAPDLARPPRARMLQADFGDVVLGGGAGGGTQEDPTLVVGLPRGLGRGPGGVVVGAGTGVGTGAGTGTILNPDLIRAQVTDEVSKRFTGQLAERDRLLKDRDTELADRLRVINDKDREIGRLAEVVAAREKALADALAAAHGQNKTPQPVAVTDFTTSLGEQLHDAQNALKTRSFSIAAVSINARGVLSEGGRKITLPDKADDRAVSDIRVNFVPDASPGGGEALAVPDVGQLTEGAARRVLASVGLVLEAITGPRSLNSGAAPGQAMLQSPVPGTPVQRGARILVTFAAET